MGIGGCRDIPGERERERETGEREREVAANPAPEHGSVSLVYPP